MFYQVTGSISFQLTTPYEHVLRYWIHRHNLEQSAFLLPGEMRYNGLFELHEMQDMFAFFNEFATLCHVEVWASRRGNDHRLFELHNGFIHEYPYMYHVDKETHKPIEHLIQILQNENFRIHINYDEFEQEELDAFEQAILIIKHNKKERFDEELNTLVSLVKKRRFIEILTDQETIRWDHPTIEFVSIFPFGKCDNPLPIIPEKPFLSSYTYNEDEKRTFTWNNYDFPLHTLFLSCSSEKTITLPDGKQVTPCSQCVFRLRQVTGGCLCCTPKLS